MLAWELCELPLLIPAERGLKLSVPETPRWELVLSIIGSWLSSLQPNVVNIISVIGTLQVR